MAVTQILSKIQLNDSWLEINLGKYHDCYLIVIKDQANKKDTVSNEDVKKVRFELGIDSGIKNKPLTIQYISLDFTDITSGNNDINKITAFTRLTNMLNTFYIRPIAFETAERTITEGESAISVNINTVILKNN